MQRLKTPTSADRRIVVDLYMAEGIPIWDLRRLLRQRGVHAATSTIWKWIANEPGGLAKLQDMRGRGSRRCARCGERGHYSPWCETEIPPHTCRNCPKQIPDGDKYCSPECTVDFYRTKKAS